MGNYGDKLPILIPVTPEVHKKLKEFSNRTGNSMASIIRIAIDEYIEHHTSKFTFVDKDDE